MFFFSTIEIMNLIKILPHHEARRIAAGEVIERPASALRELLDNAIDAKANQITVQLKAGGIEEITITDDGMGMNKEDLALCIISHATSKISTVEDLDHLLTLGFRGEALASLATCAKIEITSKVANSTAHQLVAQDGVVQNITPSAHPVGTTIRIKELFYSIPARKRFLKSTASETRESLHVFYERALAYPHISFTLIVDGKTKIHLPKTTLAQRGTALYPQQLGSDPIVLFSDHNSLKNEGFSLQIVSSPVHLFRNDKKYIHFYTNGRRIIEYAPTQALIHAYDTVLPGGQFPAGFIFLHIRSDLVDFNIHPAKREAKFQNMPLIHKAIIQLVRSKLSIMYNTHSSTNSLSFTPLRTETKERDGSLDPRTLISHNTVSSSKAPIHPESYSRITNNSEKTINSFINPQTSSNILNGLNEMKNTNSFDNISKQKSSITGNIQQSWYYLGQIFGVFLLVEKGDSLYLIDQHAAHESIRFDEICSNPPSVERLLSPINIEVTLDQMLLITLAKDELNQMGIKFEIVDEDHVALLACPSISQSVQFWEDYLLNLERGLKKTFYATIACRGSIKEGEYLDDEAAINLIKNIFSRDQPFCPHGRPLWIELSREQLYRWIKRII